MRKETIFEMTSPCRDNFRVKGYRFGEGEKTLAIVGAMRGDEVQQQYICSQLVNRLTMLEQRETRNTLVLVAEGNAEGRQLVKSAVQRRRQAREI